MPGKNEIVAGIRLEGEKEFKQEINILSIKALPLPDQN